jgi:hypothetical protein
MLPCMQEKFVAVVSDTTSAMKKLWELVEEAYPAVSAYGCQAHVVNLLLKDICKPEAMEDVLNIANHCAQQFKQQHSAALLSEAAAALGGTRCVHVCFACLCLERCRQAAHAHTRRVV